MLLGSKIETRKRGMGGNWQEILCVISFLETPLFFQRFLKSGGNLPPSYQVGRDDWPRYIAVWHSFIEKN